MSAMVWGIFNFWKKYKIKYHLYNFNMSALHNVCSILFYDGIFDNIFDVHL